jgi:hypothetical protein
MVPKSHFNAGKLIIFYNSQNQCVAARFRRKFYCLVCVAALIIYLIIVIPYVILHLTGEAVNPFNYTTKT